jgi:pimeloyl-ACP methyl ester carboxylesterase
VWQGTIDSFWFQGTVGGVKGQYDCVTAFSETDFHDDLAKVDVPMLIMQGDDDQIVPLPDSGELCEVGGGSNPQGIPWLSARYADYPRRRDQRGSPRLDKTLRD